MIPREVVSAHDYTQVTARLVKLLGGNAVAAIVLTRISWRLERLDEGAWWRANFDQIADETGLSARQVKRAVATLEDAGHLLVTNELVDGRWDRTQSYQIVWSANDPETVRSEGKPETIRSEAPGTERSEGGKPWDQTVPAAGTKRSQDPGTKRSLLPGLLDIELLDETTTTAPNGAAETNGQLILAGSPPTPVAPITAQTIIGDWIDHCQHPPPSRVKGQMAREIRLLLEDGIDPERVSAGVAEWMTRDVHPSVLPSIVNNLMNGKPRSTARAKVARIWEQADELEARERAARNADERGITS